jgi:hypothetical protein
MKIKDILQRDPAAHPLVNKGQARIDAHEELRGELATFVCEGQFADGMQKIIRSFLQDLGRTSQRGAWVSGFFGSGKSHLLKMLSHLWRNTEFPDGAIARSLVPTIPEELHALFRELDTAGRRAGGLLAAAGALPSGTTDNVRVTMLGVLLRAAGLPEQYPQARFCLWLHSLGRLERVKTSVTAEGRPFDRELNNLYVSGSIARALMAYDPNFAKTEAEARQFLKAQFPPQVSDITTEQFLGTAKDALKLVGKDGRLPCTLLVLDEVQQYIGDSNDRCVLVTEVAEAISKQLDSHVMVVGAGQSALVDVPLLQKLMDRFTIRVPLSDTDVETVTRRVLLQKKPSAVGDVRKQLEAHAGEISRQLQGTRIAERVEDRATIVDDYPLLPVRRRFWEQCFRQIDAAGTSSQLRSQLRIIHDAVAKLSERPLGAVVPADELYDALAPEMVNTGVLLRELNERIIQVGRTEGVLAGRACGLVFLIGKLAREGGADTGVRATKEHVSDLLVEDLTADNGKLRADVETVLRKLVDGGILMTVGDEYRLQTREGSEWDREFRIRQARLNNDDAAVQFKRDQLLYGAVDEAIRKIRILQGAAKEPRQLTTHRGDAPPPVDGSEIPVWVRDGWSCSERELLDTARAAGSDSPVVFVFIPRQSADDLRRLAVEVEAADQTISFKGDPTTAEGQEAKQSMASRHGRAVGERDRLVREIVGNARVYQGGGNEVLLTSLDEKIRAAAEASLVRLFPRFKDADSNAWEAVIKRAREGADQPFLPTGHAGATERHPVCQQVLAVVGAGKTGTEIRRALSASPFGWPRDAIDAALIALHRTQHLTATLNANPISAGQLDQNRIAKAEFRIEQPTLSIQERLELRKLFGQIGVVCKSGEEGIKAAEFLTALIGLAHAAGGAPPLPAVPRTTELEDIQRQVGNEQLRAILAAKDELGERINAWTALRDRAAQRTPAWDITERLARHAQGIEEAKPYLDQMEAIKEQQLLLQASDPVAAIRVELAGLLRAAVQTAFAAHNQEYDRALATLAANDVWQRLAPTQQDGITAAVGLVPLAKPEVSTDDALIACLDARPMVAARAEIDAISGRVAQAIERAAKLLEPAVQTVPLDRVTLHTEDDVEAWLGRQRTRLIAAIRQGPVLVS